MKILPGRSKNLKRLLDPGQVELYIYCTCSGDLKDILNNGVITNGYTTREGNESYPVVLIQTAPFYTPSKAYWEVEAMLPVDNIFIDQDDHDFRIPANRDIDYDEPISKIFLVDDSGVGYGLWTPGIPPDCIRSVALVRTDDYGIVSKTVIYRKEGILTDYYPISS